VDGNSVSGEGAFEERFGGFDKLMPFLILFFFSEFRSESSSSLFLLFAFLTFFLLHSCPSSKIKQNILLFYSCF